MRSLLLYFVVALFAWMGVTLFSGSNDVPLSAGFLLLMAALSAVLWERFIAPRSLAHAPARSSTASVSSPEPAPVSPARAPAVAQPAAAVRPQVVRRPLSLVRASAAPAWQPLPS